MDATSGTPVPSQALSPLIVSCLAVTWLVWGSTYLVIRFALEGFAPYFLMHTGVWLGWLYLVVFGSLIAFSAYMLLLARTSASLAASYSLVNPVVGLALGVSIGAEAVSRWEWLSVGVILVGVVLLLTGRRR